jgi:aspartyl-tRNA synthetase
MSEVKTERILVTKIPELIGKKIKIAGWVESIRDHGKITFIDLRDESGIVQCVTQNFSKVNTESVVEIVGKVVRRPDNLINNEIETGTVEVQIEKVKVLALCKEQLPIPIEGDGYKIEEDLRLKYRYLDLRRKRLQRNIRVRSDYVRYAREYLFKNAFTEIETPILTKSTPEGSRDFVVPSRIYPGKFYALPQSPQQYKQLLMSAGFEKYFQLARCIRDEDPRADRGYEHTQIDMEMSFVKKEDVMKQVEDMTIYALEKVGAKILKKPFPVFTYEEAMDKFDADKFDLRNKKQKEKGMMAFAWVIDFPFFEKSDEGWTFTHNPFSTPLNEEHEKWLLEKKNIDKIKTAQYDLVCNGYEVAGGSVRTHKAEVLKATYEVMGYSEEELQGSVGHMLEAFKYGTPPHGGCAQGVERLLMTFLGEDYVREIQAFPMTGRGRTAVMDAPSKLNKNQLDELGLRISSKNKS